MIELILLLSLISIALIKVWDKFYLNYFLKFAQTISLLLIPAFGKSSFIGSSLAITSDVSPVIILSTFLVALEVEHLDIKRWVKESIFLIFIVFVLSNSLAISLSCFTLISVILMNARKNYKLDFINLFIVIVIFAIYFSELIGTYQMTFDKYVIFYNQLSEFIFPLLFIALFTLTVISTWGFKRISSIIPLLSVGYLLLKFSNSIPKDVDYSSVGLLLFSAYTVLNFKKYLLRKNLSTAINVLFNISLLSPLMFVLNYRYDQAIVDLIMISLVLYSIRLFNVEKFNKLLDFKSVTIFSTLLNLSFFPLGISGIMNINTLATLSPVNIVIIALTTVISWIVLFYSLKKFQDRISFNLWEASNSIKVYTFSIIAFSFLILFLNLPVSFAGTKYGRILTKSSFADCCSSLESFSYSFNFSLLISIILFFVTMYGLKILDTSKLWKIKNSFTGISLALSFGSVEKKSIRVFNVNSFGDVVNKVGQSSSYYIAMLVLVLYISLLLAVLE